MNRKLIIGEWNPSVVTTYLAVVVCALGIRFALENSQAALVCLIFAGICDFLDGPIARKIKRTPQAKEFGIQLDSLADVFNFVMFPCVILVCYYNTLPSIIISMFYSIMGIARLANFNVKAINEESNGYYEGLPVTFIALLLPLAHIVGALLDMPYIFDLATMFITGALFVINIPVKKPTLKMFPAILVLAIITVFLLLRFVF